MQERLTTTINKQKVIEQYIKTAGNARLAIYNAGIKKTQFYKWLQSDPIFRANISLALQGVVRCAEDKILLKALEGDTQAWDKKSRSAKKKLSALNNTVTPYK
jgi:hypothetical protein